MQDDDLHSEVPSAERQSFIKLTRELVGLPLDKSAAALETSAAIAAISLRAGIEYLRAAPAAADVLEAAELRSWGDIGRRLALGDAENAITFFAAGVAELKEIPTKLHPLVFQLCARQITLSSQIAIETFRSLPALAKTISDPIQLATLIEVASEIARRSAKHSAEFLKQIPQVLDRLGRIKNPAVTRQGIELAAEFASRAGGIAADAWGALPAALGGLDSPDALRLLNSTAGFLERGGGSALQVLITGGDILRTLPQIFDEWLLLLWTVARHGNASLVAFVRSSPRFVRSLAREADHARLINLAQRVINLTREIAEASESRTSPTR